MAVIYQLFLTYFFAANQYALGFRAKWAIHCGLTLTRGPRVRTRLVTPHLARLRWSGLSLSLVPLRDLPLIPLHHYLCNTMDIGATFRELLSISGEHTPEPDLCGADRDDGLRTHWGRDPNPRAVEYPSYELGWREDLVKEDVFIQDGYMDIPEKPGLGLRSTSTPLRRRWPRVRSCSTRREPGLTGGSLIRLVRRDGHLTPNLPVEPLAEPFSLAYGRGSPVPRRRLQRLTGARSDDDSARRAPYSRL